MTKPERRATGRNVVRFENVSLDRHTGTPLERLSVGAEF
jgi:hypothetical protein